LIDALCILNNKTPKKGVILASEARGIGWEHREELLDIPRSLLLLGQRRHRVLGTAADYLGSREWIAGTAAMEDGRHAQ
jgi:hypothetical protein